MKLVIGPNGNIRTLYCEEIDLQKLGRIQISRGSYVEPNENGQWMVDLSPLSGPTLGPYSKRSEALQVEIEWIEERWLQPKV
ncbi:MAG: hypothetical protein J0M26_18085 [Planctomycetes bacterium]|nr:hypothetical protein [Planctomycetota bacterium]